jgi:transketolase
MILMASGSEVSLALEAGRQLAAEGRGIRVVSFPSWELFEHQDSRYRDSVLPAALSRRLVVEAGVGQGWERYASNCMTMTGFGASAPYKDLFHHFGFTVASVVERARTMLVHGAVTPMRQAA